MRAHTAVVKVLLLGAATLAAAQPPPATPGAGTGQAQAPAPATDPSALVQEVATGMLDDIDKNRRAYRHDPAKIGAVVDKYLMPHFDTETSARVVLGQYWRSATAEQRQRFINAFYHSLLANYGDSLIEFTPERLKILPAHVEPGATTATVRTEVTRRNGDRVSVNYSLRMTPQGWKAWDVVIDGISYVKSYREDFGEQIEKQGLDTVIKRLESGERPGEVARQTNG